MINENGLLNIFPTAEASGSIVSFENGADGIPMESLSVAIEPTQDLHGYDSPWPAGGGKNKLVLTVSDIKALNNLTWTNNAATSNGITFTILEDAAGNVTGIQANGTASATAQITISKTYISQGIYCLSTEYYSSTAFVRGVFRDANNVAISIGGSVFTDLTIGEAYREVPSNVAYINVYINITSGTNVNNVIFRPMLRYSTESGTYSPSSNICPITGRTGVSVYVSPTTSQADATTYAVDWTTPAGTVYHGTVDPVTGVLTVTRKTLIADGTQNVVSSSSNRFFILVSDAKVVNASNQTTYAGVVCDRLPSKAWASLVNAGIGCSPVWGAGVAFKNPNITTVEDWNTYFTNNPTQFSYELETPLTYQLTAQEVTTLLGANRVWSDAGDISLVYHTPADATPSSIDGLFINGEGLQADGWFLKWRKLAAPKPKTDYVSVWGRDGDIDLTESETDGQVFYENRELTMDMVYVGEDWTDAYSELLDMLHGKECAVQFSNDPYWYWAGRIIASLYEHKPHSLTMSGIMFPYKLSVAKVTRSATVSGAIESNGVDVVLPSSRMRVSPKVTVVAGTGESVTLKWGSKTQTLSAGTYYVRGLKVGSDDVTIKVWGTGTVTFEYRKGML